MMVIVDSILARSRGSDLAMHAYVRTWTSIDVVVDKLFDNDVKKTMYGVNEKLLEQITLADTLGKEAATEPRYWRCDWRFAQYEAAILTAHKLRHMLAAMESLVAINFKD